MKSALLLPVILTFALHSHAASFDCEKALTRTEQLICSDRQLADLDVSMMQSYRRALTQTTNPHSLKSGQRTWLRTIRDQCQDSVCLKRAYSERLEVLDNIVTATRSPAGEITGTYEFHHRHSGGGVLQILELPGNRVRFQLECSRGAPSYNVGEMDGEMTLNNGLATYLMTDSGGPCAMSFAFDRPGRVQVTQDGEPSACGFGHMVFCDGDYQQTSRQAPKFDLSPEP